MLGPIGGAPLKSIDDALRIVSSISTDPEKAREAVAELKLASEDFKRQRDALKAEAKALAKERAEIDTMKVEASKHLDAAEVTRAAAARALADARDRADEIENRLALAREEAQAILDRAKAEAQRELSRLEPAEQALERRREAVAQIEEAAREHESRAQAAEAKQARLTAKAEKVLAAAEKKRKQADTFLATAKSQANDMIITAGRTYLQANEMRKQAESIIEHAKQHADEIAREKLASWLAEKTSNKRST